MRIRCKLCRHEFDLNEDNASTRSLRQDPHQQMRVHLMSHPIETLRRVRDVGWLIDALAFVATDDNPQDKAKWRDSLIKLLDHFQEEG